VLACVAKHARPYSADSDWRMGGEYAKRIKERDMHLPVLG
jgi:hypothetical protein